MWVEPDKVTNSFIFDMFYTHLSVYFLFAHCCTQRCVYDPGSTLFLLALFGQAELGDLVYGHFADFA